MKARPVATTLQLRSACQDIKRFPRNSTDRRRSRFATLRSCSVRAMPARRCACSSSRSIRARRRGRSCPAGCVVASRRSIARSSATTTKCCCSSAIANRRRRRRRARASTRGFQGTRHRRTQAPHRHARTRLGASRHHRPRRRRRRRRAASTWTMRSTSRDETMPRCARASSSATQADSGERCAGARRGAAAAPTSREQQQPPERLVTALRLWRGAHAASAARHRGAMARRLSGRAVSLPRHSLLLRRQLTRVARRAAVERQSSERIQPPSTAIDWPVM